MVLVTGGTGLVGSHLLYALAADGEKIRALYRTAAKIDRVKELFEWYGDKGEALFNKIEWVSGDITRIPSLEKAFDGVRTVYHTAAYIFPNCAIPVPLQPFLAITQYWTKKTTGMPPTPMSMPPVNTLQKWKFGGVGRKG